jgi:hypothetical protein
MKSPAYTMRHVVGAFRLLARRFGTSANGDVCVWAQAGERAADNVTTHVGQLAHEDETNDLEAKKEIEAVIDGLRDGRVDSADLSHLQRASRLIERSAAAAHQIGEVVR